jgi:hypothetical protein
MQFDYEVPVEEYAAAQVLCYKASAKGQLVKQALGWVLLGLFFVLSAFYWAVAWAPIVLVMMLTGAWFIYWGIRSLFPARHYRRHYPHSGLAGKTYHAELDENGFAVSGDDCSWRVPWAEAQLKGEDNRVFAFSGKNTIFIFGKQYLTDEQQKEIRRLAGTR